MGVVFLVKRIKMKRIISSVILLIAISNMTGCASIISGESRKINVVTNPSGATVMINDRTRISPAEFSTNSLKNGFVVKITKEGYVPIEIDVERKVNGWAICNIFLGPGMFIGFPVDFVTGNAWKFEPMKIDETLIPIQTSVQLPKK
jgi:hypothetical protein